MKKQQQYLVRQIWGVYLQLSGVKVAAMLLLKRPHNFSFFLKKENSNYWTKPRTLTCLVKGSFKQLVDQMENNNKKGRSACINSSGLQDQVLKLKAYYQQKRRRGFKNSLCVLIAISSILLLPGVWTSLHYTSILYWILGDIMCWVDNLKPGLLFWAELYGGLGTQLSGQHLSCSVVVACNFHYDA